jgi:hypothetical protein
MLSHESLMIGTISLASIHLSLSLVLFIVLLSKPDIIKPNYITIFLFVSMLVNFIIFCLCLACRNLGTKDTKLHNNLMNTCLALSLIHFIISFIMINFVKSTDIIIVFLFVSAVVNSLIIYQSNTCKNLEQ